MLSGRTIKSVGRLCLGMMAFALPAAADSYTTVPVVYTVSGTYSKTGLVSFSASPGSGSAIATGSSSANMWQYMFSFAPFDITDAYTTLTAVHIQFSGSENHTNAIVSCALSVGCGAGNYTLNSVFTVTSAPAFSGAAAIDPLILAETGAVPALSGFSFANLGAGNTINSLVYTNTMTGSGGSLNAADFTGLGTIDITIHAARIAELSGVPGDVIAFPGVNGATLSEALTIAYYYEYTNTPEPGSIVIFSAGIGGMAMLRHRGRRGRFPFPGIQVG